LIEACLDDLESTVEKAQRAMAMASEVVLNGFTLRTDVKVILYPERYDDPRGREMWETVWEIVAKIQQLEAVTPYNTPAVTLCNRNL
jgi:hypothetical protein